MSAGLSRLSGHFQAVPAALCRAFRTQRAVIPHDRSAAFVPVEGAVMQWQVLISCFRFTQLLWAGISTPYTDPCTWTFPSHAEHLVPISLGIHCIDDGPALYLAWIYATAVLCIYGHHTCDKAIINAH